MAEISTIARPYAEALFRVSAPKERSAWADLLDDMAAVASNPDMLTVISSPRLSSGQIGEIFTAAIKQKLDAKATSFVTTLLENGRLSVMPEIAFQFRALKNHAEGSADAVIESAFELSDEQTRDLVATLEKKFGVKLKPVVSVDASLIGGVRVTVGDQVLDSSVRTRLEQMRVALTA